jgi:hypothetical protein
VQFREQEVRLIDQEVEPPQAGRGAVQLRSLIAAAFERAPGAAVTEVECADVDADVHRAVR